jgi:hypothetical protein
MMIYAILNEDGTVEGISSLAGTVDDPSMVEIPEYDPSIIGKKYEGGEFIPVQIIGGSGNVQVNVDPLAEIKGLLEGLVADMAAVKAAVTK